MPSPRPSAEHARRESTYDRERQRDGGRGDYRSAGSSSKRTDDDEDRIGPYLIGEEIGRGSFATVFRGERYVSRPSSAPPNLARPSRFVVVGKLIASLSHTALQDTHAPVAIKSVIRSKLTTKLLENLESEISILKRITHRNIVELKDCLVRPLPRTLLFVPR
jgi:serine/threonine-protein kinase ULK/ATG1